MLPYLLFLGDKMKEGYTEKVQPTVGMPDGDIPGGVGNSGNPAEFIEGEALNAREATNKPDGDQPTFTMPPFANGKDMRNKG